MFVDCCVGCYGTFCTIPTVGILRGGSFFDHARTHIAVNLIVEALLIKLTLYPTLLFIIWELEFAVNASHLNIVATNLCKCM
jgi:hypothetical protein